MKTEFSTEITVGMLIDLNEKFGLTVDINDGQITGANFSGQ